MKHNDLQLVTGVAVHVALLALDGLTADGTPRCGFADGQPIQTVPQHRSGQVAGHSRPAISAVPSGVSMPWRCGTGDSR